MTYWRRENWREQQLLEMSDELDEILVGAWYFNARDHMELWHPGTASALDSWSNYAGQDMSDYYACVAKTRDSDALQESNFRTAKRWFEEQVGEESEDTWLVGGWNHWACGHYDRILVHKSCWKAIRLGNKIGEALADYAILDEEDFSELEYEQYTQMVQFELDSRDFTEKQQDRFWEALRDSSAEIDGEGLDSEAYELLDKIQNALYLRKFPVPNENAEDDEGNVWVLSEMTILGTTGYYQLGSDPRETFTGLDRIEFEERMVDPNQLSLGIVQEEVRP